MESYRLQKVNCRECNAVTAKIISRKCTYKELLCKSAYLDWKRIEELLLYCFVSWTFFNIKIAHGNKVYLNIKINLTSKINRRFTFSVTLGLYSFCTNVNSWPNVWQPAHSSCLTCRYLEFFVVYQTLYLLIPQFLWKPWRCSMEPWLGNIDLNSGKVSLKVMLFILTSNCSHIIDITERSEDIQKTMMASKTTDDAMGLKEN